MVVLNFPDATSTGGIWKEVQLRMGSDSFFDENITTLNTAGVCSMQRNTGSYVTMLEKHFPQCLDGQGRLLWGNG